MDTASLNLLSRSVPGSRDILNHAFEASGTFSLYDERTCSQPRLRESCPTDCNRKILNIVSDEPLTIVSFDEWQTENPESKCDYLVFNSGEDKKQFAFCELTCTVEKYVEPDGDKIGKRAKAFSQMAETWRLISESENPIFHADILRYRKKIGIFGWRDRENRNTTGAMRSMNTFTRTPSSKVGISRFSDYAFGDNFDFIQVKYPYAFHW